MPSGDALRSGWLSAEAQILIGVSSIDSLDDHQFIRLGPAGLPIRGIAPATFGIAEPDPGQVSSGLLRSGSLRHCAHPIA
jgi:hypothetical protein